MSQGGHYEGIGIKERKRTLGEMYKRFCRKLEHRKQQLNSCMEFYQLAEQVIQSLICLNMQLGLETFTAKLSI